MPRIDERLATYESAVKPIRESVHLAYGMPLGQLVRAYARLFSKRHDVRVLENSLAEQEPQSDRLRMHSVFPAEAIALYEHVGRGHFRWVFADAQHEADTEGGRLALRGLHKLNWISRPQHWDFANYLKDVPFDELESYGSGRLSYDPGQHPRDATLVFFDNDAADYIPYGTVDNYLTMGAKRAFVYTWQFGDGGDALLLLNRLLEQSYSVDTPAAQCADLLIQRGATEAEAKSLLRWLGERVVLLLAK